MKWDYKIDRIYYIDNEMQRCELVYINRISNIILFNGLALGYLLISKAVKEDKTLYNAYTKKEHRKKIIDSLDEIKAFDSIKRFRFELYEKLYIDLYQAFEYFILDCYRSIFLVYPKFIRIYNDKIDASYKLSDKRYINKNVALFNDLLDFTIEKLSRTSIDDQISAFNKLPLNIRIPIRDLQRIIKFSKTRNQLVHNDGVISNQFLKKLDRQEIQHNYKIGDYLMRDYLIKTPFDSYKTLLEKTVNRISNKISKSRKNLDDFNLNSK